MITDNVTAKPRWNLPSPRFGILAVYDQTLDLVLDQSKTRLELWNRKFFKTWSQTKFRRGLDLVFPKLGLYLRCEIHSKCFIKNYMIHKPNALTCDYVNIKPIYKCVMRFNRTGAYNGFFISICSYWISSLLSKIEKISLPFIWYFWHLFMKYMIFYTWKVWR